MRNCVDYRQASVCSKEHERHPDPKTLATPHPPAAAQATQASSTTRTEFMAETSPKTLKAILETIREQVCHALKQLQDAEDNRAFRWKCKQCGYIKHFTRPASFEATGRCPRCKKNFVRGRVWVIRSFTFCSKWRKDALTLAPN
jgi:predicted Zn-ribbon and HTH transcriptional regulator